MAQHPVRLSIEDDLSRSRLTVFFRLILAIPHLVWLLLWGIVAFFAAVAKTEGFPPDVDWTVAKAAIKYADIPNFEAPMPAYNKSLKILETYRSKWFTKGGLNMDQEIEALRAELQAAWDAG